MWNAIRKYRVEIFLIFALLIGAICILNRDDPRDKKHLLPLKLNVSHSDRSGGKSKNGVSNEEQKSLFEAKCQLARLKVDNPELASLNRTGCSWMKNNFVHIAEKRKDLKCSGEYFLWSDVQNNEFSNSFPIIDGKRLNAADFGLVTCEVPGAFSFFTEKWNSIFSNRTVDDYMNVYILSFDSMSQMGFRRKMPKTVKFLEETLGSVVLNGYNIVGDGTPQAIIPILTGQTETELPLTRKRYNDAKFVDEVYPFIWNNFTDSGYVTMYGEDMFSLDTFTYRLKGFSKPPTTHYTRPLFKEIENTVDPNCVGAVPTHKKWFEYGRRFMKAYDNIPKFLFLHQGRLSHDDMNLISVQDQDLADHLAQMHKEGHFDNSLVILMADHGPRFTEIRQTHQGQLEERLPFFSLALPKKVRNTRRGEIMYKNLVVNQDRLTSPFDIYSTLMDVLKMPDPQPISQRSQSLFKPISERRTCAQAGIAPHWCTCLSWSDALSDPGDFRVSQRLARAVVDAINDETALERKLCAKLKLDKLLESKKLTSNQDLLAYNGVKDKDGFVPNLSGTTAASFAHYNIKFKTRPGAAIYEVTLFYDGVTDSSHLDLSHLSHVNPYGDKPHCVIDRNYFLATFCVCYDKI
ncbi:unnamed protein product [Caenorhabditis auriculariae]|uniref:DUF229 domain containing protein n=1 Tax=Caenorhabditis auriculariae TaxID=2777116 RepID=A0A8S1HTH4_9PELO|nr:unnamed protein product [Caenorhabditis auriculariae]